MVVVVMVLMVMMVAAENDGGHESGCADSHRLFYLFETSSLSPKTLCTSVVFRGSLKRSCRHVARRWHVWSWLNDGGR